VIRYQTRWDKNCLPVSTHANQDVWADLFYNRKVILDPTPDGRASPTHYLGPIHRSERDEFGP